MKLLTIFTAEFSYQVRNITTWLYLLVLLVFTIVMNLLTTPGDGVLANNTFYITGMVVFGCMIWLVMGAAVAGEAAARDVQTRMHPLTYSTPVKRIHYLGGRFLAAFAVNALLILSLPLGILLSFYLPDMDQGELLPFRPSAYLSVFFLIALPNAFIATALQFTFAALSRQVMTSYLASLLLAIIAQIIAVALATLFGNWDLVKLLDPVGVAGIVNSDLGTWTPTEKNTRLVTLNGMFLWNRVLWLSIAVASLFFTYLRFSFAHPGTTSSWWSRFKRKPKIQTETSGGMVMGRVTAISVPRVSRSFNFSTYLSQTLKIAQSSFRKIAFSPVGITLVALVAIVSVIFAYKIVTQFDIPLLPTTQQLLGYLAPHFSSINTPWVIIPLLIMYFAGQLVWSERDARLGDIADAVPVPEWALFTGKFLGLVLIIIVWIALIMVAGILMQLNLGYNNLEIGLYLKVLFGIQLVDYLLFAVLSLAVHVVVNQKNIGYLVMLLVFIFIAIPGTFKVEHSMLIFGASPGWWYTDMRDFGPTLWPWFLFKVYWISWALLLAVIARLFWSRGREQSFKFRFRLAQRNITRSTKWVVIAGAGLLLISGGFIFYNTNVLNEYVTGSDINERKAEYEKRYGQYRNSPQPQLTATKLEVEIYPDRQEVGIKAVYTLINKGSVNIDSIHVGSISGVEPHEVKFNQAFLNVLNDEELSHQIYVLEQPLQPGDSVEMNFVVHYKPRGFFHNGTHDLVVKNGTSFTNYDLLPSIGYQFYREVNDPVTRKKYQLAERPEMPSLFDRNAQQKPLSTDRNIFDAIIGTAKGEIAVGPGRLIKSWTAGDRSYFHYKTDVPIRGEYSILSANYAVMASKWNDVAIRIYYHPQHTLNVGRMLRSVKASLEYYTQQFGPYPFGHITIVEHAGLGGGASSEASMIDYGEQYSLMNPDDGRDGFDLPYYILAHEVAHQWFGGASITPAYVEGAGVLIEGLAVYGGMQVLENTYGKHHAQQYVNFLHSFYEMPRTLATPSLLQANETFLYYRKGGLAMWDMSKYLGKEKVNGALRAMLQKHRSGELPLLTTLDLYREVETVTPDSLSYLLTDLFKTNTYWRLKTKQFAAEQTESGSWQVTLKLDAQKVITDSTGAEKEIPMKDWLEVGIYEEGDASKEPLYLQMHRIHSGEQFIKVTVPRKPQRGGIDPNYLMIDLRRDDNIMYLEE